MTKLVGIERRVLLYSGFKKRKKLLNKYIENKTKHDLSKENKNRFYASEDWKTLRDWAKQFYYDECVCCRGTEELQLDHITPITIEPKKCLDRRNLQWLCRTCNEIKSNRNSRKFHRRKKSIRPKVDYRIIMALTEKWNLYFPEIIEAGLEIKDSNC